MGKILGWIFGGESNGSDANCEVLSTNSINCHEFGYKLEIQEEEIEITEGEGGR